MRNFDKSLKHLPSCSSPLIDILKYDIFEVDFLLVHISVSHCSLIPIFSHKFSFAKLLEVFIVVPELEVFRLCLETSHLIEYTHICGAVFWAELLRYFF